MYKSKLQEMCQRRRWPLPEYTTAREGPPHLPSFSCNVSVNGQIFPSPSICKSTKDAQNMAAQFALNQLTAPSSPNVNCPPPPPAMDAYTPMLGTPQPTSGVNLPVHPPPGVNLPVHPPPEVNLPPPGANLPVHPPPGANLPVHPPPGVNLPVHPPPGVNVPVHPPPGVNVPVHPPPGVNSSPLYSPDSNTCAGLLTTPPKADNQTQEPGTAVVKQQTLDENVPNTFISVHCLDGVRKGMSHIYKNLLQQHAQKKACGLPLYSSETEGPSHAPLFRSRVSVDGKSFTTQELFTTLKEAEQAAAKVACRALSLNVVQEDVGFQKNFLQEFTQRKGLLCPSYETIISGSSHAPVFLSTVKIGGSIFQGEEARTKKQAEINAAKVACSSLIDGFQPKKSSTVPSDSHLPSVSDVILKIEVKTPTQKKTDTLGEEFQPTESLKLPSDHQFPVAGIGIPKIEKDISTRKQIDTRDEEALCSKRAKTSSSDNVTAVMPDPSSSVVPSASIAGEVVNSCPASNRTVVVSRNAGLVKPECVASAVVFSDDQWIAYKAGVNQNPGASA